MTPAIYKGFWPWRVGWDSCWDELFIKKIGFIADHQPINYGYWLFVTQYKMIKQPTLIARFMGPTWGPSGAGRTQVGPMLALWTCYSVHELYWTHNCSSLQRKLCKRVYNDVDGLSANEANLNILMAKLFSLKWFRKLENLEKPKILFKPIGKNSWDLLIFQGL